MRRVFAEWVSRAGHRMAAVSLEVKNEKPTPNSALKLSRTGRALNR